MAQDLPDVCQESSNILVNCNFNNGLDHWQSYIEDGGANFSVLQGGGECHAPLCPAAYIVTEGHFVGGLYQQVSVSPGNTYYANIIWLVFDSLANDASVNGAVGGIGRRIGIDPFGGTDSRSPNVVWSVDNWRNDCKICGVEQVVVTAQAEVITVFLRIDDTWRVRAKEKGFAIPPTKDQFWIDDLGLKQIEEGSDLIPTPTPTEAPPATDTPAPPPPTATATPQPRALTETSDAPAEGLLAAAESESAPDQEAGPLDMEGAAADGESPELVDVQTTPTPLAGGPAATNTAAPPPTLTPTMTRTATPTRDRQLVAAIAPTAAPQPRPVSEPRSAGPATNLWELAGTTVCIGGVFVLMMGVVLAGLTWLYRLGWGNARDEEPGDELDEDVAEVEIEIIR